MEPIFTRLKLIQHCCVKNPDAKFHESGLVAETSFWRCYYTQQVQFLHHVSCLCG